MIESKASTLELFHKGSTMEEITDGYKIDVKSPNVVRKKFILDVLDGSTHLRIYVPDGEVTERGEITYVNDETISYNVTVTCYPVNDVVLSKFSDDAYWAYS
jgi:1,2-phenylacetyl-CoA epoxidase catalytic subunit